tara:strand:+ start:1172 stop:1390 length:219 start_codon:yes stop_codon:yes gene_type:complete
MSNKKESARVAKYLVKKDQFGLNSSALERLGDYALNEEINIKIAVDWRENASMAKPSRGALNPESWVGILRK